MESRRRRRRRERNHFRDGEAAKAGVSFLDQEYTSSSPMALFILVAGWRGNTSSLIVSECHFRCAAAATSPAGWLRHETIQSLRSTSRLIDGRLKAEWRRFQGLYSGGEGGEAVRSSSG